MKIHKLKIEQDYFDSIMAGQKTCEIRKDDRHYTVGDIIIFDKDPEVKFLITHIERYKEVIKEGYVVLSISFYIASINRKKYVKCKKNDCQIEVSKQGDLCYKCREH